MGLAPAESARELRLSHYWGCRLCITANLAANVAVGSFRDVPNASWHDHSNLNCGRIRSTALEPLGAIFGFMRRVGVSAIREYRVLGQKFGGTGLIQPHEPKWPSLQ